MGFGNGYSSKRDMGGKRYSNDMVAHVWNAGEVESGQSGNGNLFFRGRAIYSYGTHFVIAYRMPDGLVLVNADSYSVSTSGHQSDVRGAIRNRKRVNVAGLTDLATDWKLLPRLASYLERERRGDGIDATERKAMRDQVRNALVTHAAALDSVILEPGEWGHDSWDYETTPATRVPFDRNGRVELGAYLAELVKLPPASWTKAKRDAAAIKAKAERDTAAALASRAERDALALADMSDSDWRKMSAQIGTGWTPSVAFQDLGKRLKRARSLMLAAKSGKLAAKSRLATIRARIKATAALAETADARRQGRVDRNTLAVALGVIRAWRDASPEAHKSATWHAMRDLERSATEVARLGRTTRLKLAAGVLAGYAGVGMRAIQAEDSRLAALDRAERERLAADRQRAWLAGEWAGAVRFDSPEGGPALRVYGDELQTSWGATVPLSHAVKAFRFVKLCRERGESWHRNGRTIRVGHFQVDSVAANGGFVAGCHSFRWSEVERVAKAAGVFDCAPSDSALESSGHAHAA